MITELIIGGVAIAIALVIAARIIHYKEVVEEQQERINIIVQKMSEEFANSYHFVECDRKMINDTVKMLLSECPEGIQERLLSFGSHEMRKEYVEDLVRHIADVMGVELEGVEITDDMPDCTLGLYQQGYITINEVHIEADPERLLHTIIHELRHGVQFQACQEGKDQWGFSTETKAYWYKNFVLYVDEPYELYVNQPLERDANTIAEEIINRFNQRRNAIG